MKSKTPKNQKPTDAAAPPGPPQPGAIHLEINGVRAETVCIAGSFNDWQPETVPLKPVAPGRWVADLALKPGRYEYLLVVDGRGQSASACSRPAPHPPGGAGSVLEL